MMETDRCGLSNRQPAGLVPRVKAKTAAKGCRRQAAVKEAELFLKYFKSTFFFAFLMIFNPCLSVAASPRSGSPVLVVCWVQLSLPSLTQPTGWIEQRGWEAEPPEGEKK
ncbi:hypothetical protein CHARACLAT_014470 [Characodon lateralis]|uniref:Uncharacterized protein n=1 Tax=Characodon lateralis TaxID=208331 RepID=A0ABU7F2Y1_9TELE|nr:hypothetical protein [Characodon lateralis]